MSREFSKSIRLKLVGIVVVAVLVATLLAAAGAAWRETSRRFELRKEALSAVASALASSVAAATKSGDRRAIAAGLGAIRTMPQIQYAIVVDAAGQRLHQIGSGVLIGSPDEAIEANRDLGLFSTARLGTHLVSVPVVSGGETVGHLAIIADVSELRRALFDSILGALAAGSIASVIALLIAARMQASITAPILALTRVADHVRSTGDFTVPAPKLSSDETGHLVDAFNTMMAEIAERDQALKRHRDSLASEVAARTRDLAAAKDAAERANAAKSDFLATMSHEIRTPMNGMLVMAEMLAADELSPKAQRRCEIIVKSGEVLLTLINDILDLSKIEAGRLELELVACDPAGIVEDVVQLFAERAVSSRLEIACRIGRSVPRSVLADPLRLRQIVTNLASNALKFTQTGGVLIGLDAINVPSGRSALQLTVKDTGVGIPQDKLSSIFEAFTQADASTTRRFGGTGIGLAICRQLATAMGGFISVESEEGRGTTFKVEVPVEVLEAAALPGRREPAGSIVLAIPDGPIREAVAASAADLGLREAADVMPCDARILVVDARRLVEGRSPCGDPRVPTLVIATLGDASATRLVTDGCAHAALAAPIGGRSTREALARAMGDIEAGAPSERATAPPAFPMPASIRNVRVLAADDDPVNREVLGEVLAKLGALVTTVESGSAAIEMRRAEHFDLIFMDGSMPGMDGFEASRRIREWEARTGVASVPIVALTAHAIGPQAQMWRQCGMNDHVTKPFTVATIRACLERWVRPRDTKDAGAHPQQDNVQTESFDLIDVNVLRAIQSLDSRGDDLVHRVVDLYCKHAPQSMAAIAACGPGDAATLAEAAHALKSLSRNIGAVRVAALCESLEADARSGQRFDDAILKEVGNSLAATISELRRRHPLRAA